MKFVSWIRSSATALVAAGFLALLVNSAYLAAFATASLAYFAQVGLHVVFGFGVAVAALAWLVSRRARVPRLILGGAVPLTAAVLIGAYLSYTGTTQAYRPALRIHIILSVLGSIPIVVELARQGLRLAGRSRWLLLGGVTVVVLSAAGALYGAATHQRHRGQAFRIANPADPGVIPASMREEGAGPHGAFFPSSANTSVNGTIPSTFFMTSDTCRRCHQQIYEEWNESAHHMSSFNNQWYRKAIEYMQDVVGTQPSKWCAGCHDHAVFFNGRFDKPIKQQIDTPEAQAGLACTSCHAITRVGSTMGQGHFEIEYPPLHDLAASTQPQLQWMHDKLLELDPQPHRETFLKPFHSEQTADFCSSCHKVHLDVPVNGYRWFRGFNEYDNWQASGMSGEGARSFYYPPKSQSCADCHMPLVASTDPAAKHGFHKSHRFPAANTALPFVNGHTKQLEITQQFLEAGVVSVDIFGLARGETNVAGAARAVASTEGGRVSSTFAVGEESASFGAAETVLTAPAEVVAPLGTVDAVVRRGESARVEVVVRTRRIGHFFPGGTVDAFDVWVELEAVDGTGRTILHSGAIEGPDTNGPVDPAAHFYRSLQLDGQGNPINKRNAWMARSVAYVRLIPPGAADTIHYRLDVPADAGDEITLKAKVNYRKFAWWNTQWAYAGEPDPKAPAGALDKSFDSRPWTFTASTAHVSGKMKAIPVIPITTLARHEVKLRVLDARAPMPAAPQRLEPSVRERWNDYGIGLLLQGDLKGAEATFLKVTRMEPGYADGWVNVARARIQEGNLAGAEEMLRQALTIDPELAKTHFFLALALKATGRYDEALDHLRRAAAKYPRDRVVRNQLGRVLFLKRQYAQALDEFKTVLSVDPEDLQAHYNMMLAYQGLGQADPAARSRRLYERFKADEASQALTGPYRQLHPYDNNERQSVHEHGSLAALPAPALPKPVTRSGTR